MRGILGGFMRQARHLKRVVQRAEVSPLRLGAAGDNVRIGDGCDFSGPGNVFLGNDVYIGNDCWLTAPNARIIIGNKVMFAPQVALITGDHNTRVVGTAMFDVHDKAPGDDADIRIEDDVWVGFRAIVLKGVTLGSGCVVAAGAIVTRDVPCYAIVAGSPARVVGMRFTPEEIRVHEAALGIAQAADGRGPDGMV